MQLYQLQRITLMKNIKHTHFSLKNLISAYDLSRFYNHLPGISIEYIV